MDAFISSHSMISRLTVRDAINSFTAKSLAHVMDPIVEPQLIQVNFINYHGASIVYHLFPKIGRRNLEKNTVSVRNVMYIKTPYICK